MKMGSPFAVLLARLQLWLKFILAHALHWWFHNNHLQLQSKGLKFQCHVMKDYLVFF